MIGHLSQGSQEEVLMTTNDMTEWSLIADGDEVFWTMWVAQKCPFAKMALEAAGYLKMPDAEMDRDKE